MIYLRIIGKNVAKVLEIRCEIYIGKKICKNVDRFATLEYGRRIVKTKDPKQTLSTAGNILPMVLVKSLNDI